MCCMWRLVAARRGRLQLTTTLLPHPFGPTTQVKSAKGPITALSLKLLKPVVNKRDNFEVLARTVCWSVEAGSTYPRPPGVSDAAACCRCCLPAWLQVDMSQA